jgi:hypothetical protein
MSTKTKTAEKTAKTAEKKTAEKTAPKSALTFKGYKPEARAIVKTIAKNASAATVAEGALCDALADGFTMSLHTVTGHRDATAWGLSLLEEAAPNGSRSTRYGWIERAYGIIGCRTAGADPAQFQTDSLRYVGSKASGRGQDPQRMADMVREIVGDESLRNKSGKVDTKKVRTKYSDPKPSTPSDHAASIAEYAIKHGGKNAIALLNAAIIIIRDSQKASKA